LKFGFDGESSGRRYNMKQAILMNEKNYPAIEHFSYLELSIHCLGVRQLGYNCFKTNTGTYLDVPDEKMLLAKIKQIYPDFNEQISGSYEIEDDKTYATAYLSNFLVISKGKETVHDHGFHAIRTLSMFLEDRQAYYEAREKIRTLIADAIRTVELAEKSLKVNPEEIKKAYTFIGAAVDVIWAAPDLVQLKIHATTSFNQLLKNMWDHYINQAYWKKRYAEEINGDMARHLWLKITLASWPNSKL
ncbi:MAG: hypothetical protein ABSA17_07795, partial [Rhabdochlamydiaceae bacterium]|jgi:hypothetical protein